MYGKKINNLLSLQDAGFIVPNFNFFSQTNIPEYSKVGLLNSPFILRSSFSIEDGSKYSFAGIFESFFPISNVDEYKKAIKKCLNSDIENKYTTYVKLHNMKGIVLQKNFIIQEFVSGSFSGVCFTNNSDNQIYIEIVPGINQPLVEGRVSNPFSILINRRDIKNFYIKSFYMDREYTVVINNKIEKKYFDIRDFEESIILNYLDKMIYNFLSIEKLFGYPQDIEFTVKDNDIFILQSRNITIS